MGANSTHSSNGLSDNSGPLLLPPTVVMDDMTSGTVATVENMARAQVLLAPTTAMGHLTTEDCCYHW
jgi:hypothetical protein